MNQLKLDGVVKAKFCHHIKEKITPKTAAMYYQLSKIYNLSSISKVSINYIELWFTTVAETYNFLELDIDSVLKIFSNSNLEITSEIEVFYAADAWINHNFVERSKHAKTLLLTIRLHLLTNHVLKHVLQKSSSFKKIEICHKIIREVLENRETCLKQSTKDNLTSKKLGYRSYKQNNFDILHCGEYFRPDINTTFVAKIDSRNLLSYETVPTLTKNRIFSYYYSPMVYLKGHVYLLGCLHNESKDLKKIEKYSIATDSLEVVGNMFDDRKLYSVCGFIDKIYFCGGEKDFKGLSTCVCFDTNKHTWINIASMNEKRSSASCAVYEERIVVSAGINGTSLTSNTVEAYDHIADEWSYMPSMLEKVDGHYLVAIKNKLFSVGSWKNTFEVYDSTCERFVSIKQPFYSSHSDPMGAISLNNKVIIFSDEKINKCFCYHVDKGEWSVEPCFRSSGRFDYVIKIPKIKI